MTKKLLENLFSVAKLVTKYAVNHVHDWDSHMFWYEHVWRGHEAPA